KTPYSIRSALQTPIHRNLHDAVIPGFALHWDLEDVVKAIGPRQVLWSDPTDWMGVVRPNVPGAVYRTFDEGDERFLGRRHLGSSRSTEPIFRSNAGAENGCPHACNSAGRMSRSICSKGAMAAASA